MRVYFSISFAFFVFLAAPIMAAELMMNTAKCSADKSPETIKVGKNYNLCENAQVWKNTYVYYFMANSCPKGFSENKKLEIPLDIGRLSACMARDASSVEFVKLDPRRVKFFKKCPPTYQDLVGTKRWRFCKPR